MPADDIPEPKPETRFFPQEQCCALLIDKRRNKKTYRKPDGDYIIVQSFRGKENNITTKPAFPLANPSEHASYHLSDWPHKDWKRMTVRFFHGLNCAGLLIHQKEDGTRIYSKPNGQHIHVKPDNVTDMFKVTKQEIIKDPSEPYAIRQNKWPGIMWQEPRKAHIRFFVENNCSGILVNREMDSLIYKTPTNGCIVILSLNGHEARLSYPICKLDYPTEGRAMNANTWPGFDWKRPQNWKPEL